MEKRSRNIHFVAQVVDHLFDTCLDDLYRTLQTGAPVRNEPLISCAKYYDMGMRGVRVAVENGAIANSFSTCLQKSIFLRMETQALV